MCAAPSSAYLTEKLPLQDVGVVKYDNLLALKLSEYGANIKSLFYLDALLVAKENGGTKEGFCGMVIVGGANAAMHNTARYGKGRTSPDNGATKYIILNDGGLNTLGIATFLSVINNVFTNFTVNLDFKSAYYLGSTDFGLVYRWRNDANTAWLEWNYVSMSSEGQIPSNTNLNKNGVVPIKRPVNEFILAQVKGYHTNADGIYEEQNITTLYPRLKPILLQLNGWTNNPTTYYVNDDEIIAGGNESTLTGLWANDDMSGGRYTTTMQLWRDSRYYYTYGYDTVNDIWCFLSLTDTEVPGPTFAEFDYVFYKSDTNLTIDDINDEMMASPTGPGWVTGKIYNPLPPDHNSDKWYLNETFTILANGWYVQGTFVVGARRALKIISGIVVEDYNNE